LATSKPVFPDLKTGFGIGGSVFGNPKTGFSRSQNRFLPTQKTGFCRPQNRFLPSPKPVFADVKTGFCDLKTGFSRSENRFLPILKLVFADPKTGFS